MAELRHQYHGNFPSLVPRQDRPASSSDTPWMTSSIERLIQKRNRMFHTDAGKYNLLRNKVARALKTSKRSYYTVKVQYINQVNTKQWFSKLKSFCGLRKQSSSLPCTSHLLPDAAAEELNDHFAALRQTLPPLLTNILPAYLSSPSPPPVVQDVAGVTKIN